MGGKADAGRRAPRVLIVEDDEDPAESLRMRFESCGHAAAVALGGRDGIDRARTFEPDLILCDLAMPEVDGLKVAEAIRADGLLKRKKLVALTGLSQPDYVLRAFQAGFDEYLLKPAAPKRLLDLLDRAVSPGKRRRP